MAGMEAKLTELQAENTAMEQEIMALTKSGGYGNTAAKSATASGCGASTSTIKVLKFGNNAECNEAGVDNGSSWCPPQCSRRTVLGGFFTS